jgi:hypothetical protein
MAGRRYALINKASTAEVNDLTAAVTWANVPDANITETSVTQHEAALAIIEAQITGAAFTNWNTAYGWGDHASGGYLTDIVNDTSPQLGANLASNGFDIKLADLDRIYFGTGDDYYLTYDSNSLDFVPAATGDQLNMTLGTQLRVWDSTNGEAAQITSVGNNAIYGSTYTRAAMSMQTQSIADDATATFTFPDGNGGFALVVGASTTSVGTNDSAIIFCQSTTALTEIYIGTNVVTGTANPDTDTKLNLFLSSSGVLGVKNRRGTSRYVTVYFFIGDA